MWSLHARAIQYNIIRSNTSNLTVKKGYFSNNPLVQLAWADFPQMKSLLTGWPRSPGSPFWPSRPLEPYNQRPKNSNQIFWTVFTGFKGCKCCSQLRRICCMKLVDFFALQLSLVVLLMCNLCCWLLQLRIEDELQSRFSTFQCLVSKIKASANFWSKLIIMVATWHSIPKQ